MPDHILIETLDPADIELVAPLWKQLLDYIASLPDALVPVRPSDESWELERKEMLAELAGESFVLVSRAGDRVTGYAYVCVEGPDPVWYTGDKHALLAALCVAAEERGTGIGAALMDALDAELDRRGVEDVEIGVDTGNEVATRLYESRGYRPDFRIFYGSPGGRPWACLRREEEDRRARRGRFAPSGLTSPGPTTLRETDAVPVAAAAPGIERLDPAHLDALEPLWDALMARHAEVWSLLPMREPHRSWKLRRGQYEGWLADEGSFVLVARRDDVPVGYLMVDVDEGDETYVTGDRVARLETLVVAEGERDVGVGGLLVDAAMIELERLGVVDLFVGYMDGNEAARRFYERRGFTPFVHHLYAKRPGARPAVKEDP